MIYLRRPSSLTICAFLSLGLIVYLASCKNLITENKQSASAFFVFDVLPIIQSKCLSCHGDNPEKIEGGLDLRTRESFLEGGDVHDELVTAGRPEFSPMY